MKKTPSHQSVIVPVEPTDEMLSVFARQWHMRDFPSERFDHATPAYVEACKNTMRECWAVMLAAPAPSSLAGGEVSRQTIIDAVKVAMNDAWCDITSDTDCWPADLRRVSQRGPMRLEYRPAIWTDTTAEMAANAILAALSPEAPARATEEDVEDTPWPESPLANALFRHVQSQFSLYDDEASEEAGEIIAILVKHGVDPTKLPALTPRHEAPAALCDHGHTDPMALCSDCEAASIEAPAEGAGALSEVDKILRAITGDEPRTDLEGAVNRCLAIIHRARSSAPEAREGEAWGWAVTWIEQGFGQQSEVLMGADHERFARERAENESGRPGNSNVMAFPIYTHPAAPSADKLLAALEEIAEIGTMHHNAHDEFDRGAKAARLEAREIALAALKAEV